MFGKRLSALRKQKGLSQYELADKLGYSRGQIANYEQGKREPDYETLQKIADFFDVTTDYLLGRTDIRTLNDEDDSLAEINKLIKEYGIEKIGFFDIDKWKNLSKDDIDEIRRHFEWVAQKAKERNDENSSD
ncbi:helix-turn-helix transcriptional regulator [Weizmannia sp. CD-2023]|jgi:transcriptional regulator with XRE-family HTH domain|uniref:helix-turn-helix domain-containing protein n=1 Tax=Heyndrickxia TaxID=2837504 RepID=UPI0017F38D3A|nr:helix-turn-helix transcriptional regulator [Weizmannia sp. CD-2023]MED4902834.1 helix-turn-helix transcriptional regulator [Weizmannia sp. CD-2023]NWN95301.1 helix-turn-helix transcriptional regulator [Bacillus sp. (in: firmicutes)]